MSAVAIPVHLRMVDYSVPAFSMEEIESLGSDLLQCPPPTPPPVGAAVYYLTADVTYIDKTSFDYHFTRSVMMWLEGNIGDGVDGLISRDDAFCSIFQHLAGMDKYCRNRTQDASASAMQVNRTDRLQGVPLLFTAEDDSYVQYAEGQLKQKFRWLPHFAGLPFVFGIAISPNRLRIMALKEFGWPTCLFEANLNFPSQHWQCVVAAINIARTIKGFVESKKLHGISSSFSFDVWHEREHGKRLRLGLQCIEVEYRSDETYSRMVAFYENIRGVPHLERFYGACGPCHTPKDNRIKLQPVGVQRVPRTLPELVKCLQDIGSALTALHAKGYYHCDVRWPNIVECFGEWYLIDCEHFCSENDDETLRRARAAQMRPAYVLDTEVPWSATHDWYQLGVLLSHYEVRGLYREYKPLKALNEKLLSKTFNVAAVQKSVRNLAIKAPKK